MRASIFKKKKNIVYLRDKVNCTYWTFGSVVCVREMFVTILIVFFFYFILFLNFT